MEDRLKRQTRLLALLRLRTFARQDDVVDALREDGFDVTQSLISRDFHELGIIKAAGRYIAVTKDPDPAPRSVGGLIRSIEPIGQNLIVIKTPIGAANVVALELDNHGIEGIAGTVAGDDTIFVAVRNKRTQGHVVEALGRLA